MKVTQNNIQYYIGTSNDTPEDFVSDKIEKIGLDNITFVGIRYNTVEFNQLFPVKNPSTNLYDCKRISINFTGMSGLDMEIFRKYFRDRNFISGEAYGSIFWNMKFFEKFNAKASKDGNCLYFYDKTDPKKGIKLDVFSVTYRTSLPYNLLSSEYQELLTTARNKIVKNVNEKIYKFDNLVALSLDKDAHFHFAVYKDENGKIKKYDLKNVTKNNRITSAKFQADIISNVYNNSEFISIPGIYFNETLFVRKNTIPEMLTVKVPSWCENNYPRYYIYLFDRAFNYVFYVGYAKTEAKKCIEKITKLADDTDAMKAWYLENTLKL